ncbi:MAG: NUDIX domain-containing protein [Acidimicrobiales bacterium]
MAKLSAGLLLFRGAGSGPLEVLLVHPGGPLWATRDEGAWSIPKGEVDDDDAAVTAEREFTEELGSSPPAGARIDLGQIVQKGGKRVHAWAVAGDLDTASVRSNTFEMQWPPRSGRIMTFPEIDRAAWLDLAAARVKVLEAQTPFLDRLVDALAGGGRR